MGQRGLGSEGCIGVAWWQETVVYEVYVRSFRDADGDGVGDLPGVLEGLGYLAALGVDASG